MLTFKFPKPWTLALAASFALTYSSFTFIASSFQHVASDAACAVTLPLVTVVGKRALMGDELATQSAQMTPAASSFSSI